MRKNRRRALVWVAAAAFVAAAALALGHAPLLTAAGNALKIGCLQPAHSDALIVLGGELLGERTRKAAELYKAGAAPHVMLSDGTTMSWRTTAMKEMFDLAVLEGVPADRIVREDRSRSTYENALYTKELMAERGWDSALVVTTDWHGKRARFIFDKLYAGTGIELGYCGIPDGRSDFAGWWTDGEKQQVVLTEWSKMIVYWLKYSW